MMWHADSSSKPGFLVWLCTNQSISLRTRTKKKYLLDKKNLGNVGYFIDFGLTKLLSFI